MLSELFIDNYRGIRNLDLGPLGLINIIAGANNAGKTSILEVIRSLEAPNDMKQWRKIGYRDNINNLVFPGMRTSVYETMDSLFSYDLDGRADCIKYSGECEKGHFVVEIDREITEVFVSEKELEEYQMVSRAGRLKNSEMNVEYDTQRMDLVYRINGFEAGNDTLYDIPGTSQGLGTKRKIEKFIEPVVYISPVQHAQNQLYLKSVLSDSELYEQFVEIMRYFDPGFLSVNSVDGKYVVLSKNHKKALPLNAYGDGMKKAMLLLSAVLRAKNGILLLDEFETAIHVSAMQNVFEWIITTAAALNVQIFMTSHSIEAIESVLKCSLDLQKEIRMITLVKVGEELKVRNVDGEKAVQLLDEYGLELR